MWVVLCAYSMDHLPIKKKKKSYENGAAQILVKNLSTGCPYFTSTELLYDTQLKLEEMLSSLCYFWREK